MKKYSFGDCIPESIKLYNRLKKQGKKPKFVEGYVEVNNPPDDLPPDGDFLDLYLSKRDDNNYKKVFQHTWIICEKKVIDKTKNQFDKYGRILYYYEKERYWFKGNLKVTLGDLDTGMGLIWKYNLQKYYVND